MCVVAQSFRNCLYNIPFLLFHRITQNTIDNFKITIKRVLPNDRKNVVKFLLELFIFKTFTPAAIDSPGTMALLPVLLQIEKSDSLLCPALCLFSILFLLTTLIIVAIACGQIDKIPINIVIVCLSVCLLVVMLPLLMQLLSCFGISVALISVLLFVSKMSMMIVGGGTPHLV